MKNIIAALAVAFTVLPATAAPERSLPMDSIVMEDIHVDSIVQQWTFRKICLDGQAYLLLVKGNTPFSMSPSFKDGKPEQCQAVKVK